MWAPAAECVALLGTPHADGLLMALGAQAFAPGRPPARAGGNPLLRSVLCGACCRRAGEHRPCTPCGRQLLSTACWDRSEAIPSGCRSDAAREAAAGGTAAPGARLPPASGSGQRPAGRSPAPAAARGAAGMPCTSRFAMRQPCTPGWAAQGPVTAMRPLPVARSQRYSCAAGPLRPARAACPGRRPQVRPAWSGRLHELGQCAEACARCSRGGRRALHPGHGEARQRRYTAARAGGGTASLWAAQPLTA